MIRTPFKRVIKDDFVIIDSQFPQSDPFGFRNTEINQYLERIKNASSYSMYPMKPGPEAWFSHGYGIEDGQFKQNVKGYLKSFPNNQERVHHLEKRKTYRFKLAYSFFLAETYVLLPFFEKNKIPFAFVLYPGGAFGLDNEGSDNMLRKIFQSKYFQGVIVTQQLIQDYLLVKSLCSKDKITLIYGGFTQFNLGDIQPKQYYPKNKATFDVCFVAAKYSKKGVDKGYDLFIETAKRLCKATNDISFHVIGNFSESDIDVMDIKSRITFYGYKQPEFLKEFYAGMDIFLGASRPFRLYEGNFDGFPLGADAGYCGTALFVSDELKMNKHFFVDGKEIVIVPLSASKITDKILYYYRNLDKLYDLSRLGQEKCQYLFSIDKQIDERIKFFKNLVDLDMSTNVTEKSAK